MLGQSRPLHLEEVGRALEGPPLGARVEVVQLEHVNEVARGALVHALRLGRIAASRPDEEGEAALGVDPEHEGGIGLGHRRLGRGEAHPRARAEVEAVETPIARDEIAGLRRRVVVDHGRDDRGGRIGQPLPSRGRLAEMQQPARPESAAGARVARPAHHPHGIEMAHVGEPGVRVAGRRQAVGIRVHRVAGHRRDARGRPRHQLRGAAVGVHRDGAVPPRVAVSAADHDEALAEGVIRGAAPGARDRAARSAAGDEHAKRGPLQLLPRPRRGRRLRDGGGSEQEQRAGAEKQHPAPHAPPCYPGIWASSGRRSHAGFHSGTVRPAAPASVVTSAANARRTSSLSRTLSRYFW